jgi:SAM-dependent methyltransferase
VEVYEFHLPIGYSNGDVEYYERSLLDVRGRILEPATGTGRVLIPLLQAGLRVEGLDHSPDMLAACRRNCRERGLDPLLHLGDMSAFVRPSEYEAVIIPAGSIRNLDGRDGTLRALACFHESLVPGGRIMIDVPAPRWDAEVGPLRLWSQGDDVLGCQQVALDYDPVLNRTTQFLRYDKWRDGELVTTELHRFWLQHWGLLEFEELLVEAGFREVSVTADYREGSTPGRLTRDWTFHAVRP